MDVDDAETLSNFFKQAHDLTLGSQPWKGTAWRERKGSQCSGARRTIQCGKRLELLGCKTHSTPIQQYAYMLWTLCRWLESDV